MRGSRARNEVTIVMRWKGQFVSEVPTKVAKRRTSPELYARRAACFICLPCITTQLPTPGPRALTTRPSPHCQMKSVSERRRKAVRANSPEAQSRHRSCQSSPRASGRRQRGTSRSARCCRVPRQFPIAFGARGRRTDTTLLGLLPSSASARAWYLAISAMVQLSCGGAGMRGDNLTPAFPSSPN